MFSSAFCKALFISAIAFCFWALVKLELFRISWRFLLAKSIISCLAKILASINAFKLSISFWVLSLILLMSVNVVALLIWLFAFSRRRSNLDLSFSLSSLERLGLLSISSFNRLTSFSNSTKAFCLANSTWCFPSKSYFAFLISWINLLISSSDAFVPIPLFIKSSAFLISSS